jgi:subtilisin
MTNPTERSGESRRARRSESEQPGDAGHVSPAAESARTEMRAPGTTGRYLMLLREDAVPAGIKALTDTAGLSVVRAADFGGAVDAEALAGAEAMVFDELRVVVVAAQPDQLGRVNALAAEESGILAMEPEREVFVPEPEAFLFEEPSGSAGTPMSNIPAVPSSFMTPAVGFPLAYLRAYQAGVNDVVERVLGLAGLPAGVAAAPGAAPVQLDESQFTWGLQVTNVAASQCSGRGVRVAVLDTGFDLQHPDFAGRRIVSKSFVAGEEVQDGHGHGTHVIGTACGPKQPNQLPRYGVAYEAEIFAGKVLSNQGSGADGGILAGINWAITNNCAIISMSLGAPTQPGQSFSRVFEAVARRALAAGTLIIVAAGNESRRPGPIAPVGHPANCPSILAVAAVDQQLQVASFSCGGVNPQGGQVDIAGPGVAVRSSWIRPTLYRTIPGTSMATPHVAGIAALHAEANPDMRGGALGWLLLQSSRRLDQPARDVGVGLVQAP